MPRRRKVRGAFRPGSGSSDDSDTAGSSSLRASLSRRQSDLKARLNRDTKGRTVLEDTSGESSDQAIRKRPRHNRPIRSAADRDDPDEDMINDNDQDDSTEEDGQVVSQDICPTGIRQSVRLGEMASMETEAPHGRIREYRGRQLNNEKRADYLKILAEVKKNPREPLAWEDNNPLLRWCECRRLENDFVELDCVDANDVHDPDCDGVHSTGCDDPLCEVVWYCKSCIFDYELDNYHWVCRRCVRRRLNGLPSTQHEEYEQKVDEKYRLTMPRMTFYHFYEHQCEMGKLRLDEFILFQPSSSDNTSNKQSQVEASSLSESPAKMSLLHVQKTSKDWTCDASSATYDSITNSVHLKYGSKAVDYSVGIAMDDSELHLCAADSDKTILISLQMLSESRPVRCKYNNSKKRDPDGYNHVTVAFRHELLVKVVAWLQGTGTLDFDLSPEM